MKFTFKLMFSIIFIFSLLLLSCNKGQDQQQKTTSTDDIQHIESLDDLTHEIESNPDKVLVIDLYADWCMPCKQLSPIMHSLKVQFSGVALFYKVNVDKSATIAAKYNVQGIPYVIFIKNKEVFYTLTGLYTEDTYKKVITICSEAKDAAECQQKMQQ